MRIDDNTLQKIKEVFQSYLKHKKAELRLFGSRVNDSLRGGDIDLLLILDSPSAANEIADIKHYLLADLKTAIGEQKIDLIITDSENIKTDTFLESILPQSISISLL